MKKRGCCSTILIVFITIVVIAAIAGITQSQKKGKSSSSGTAKTEAEYEGTGDSKKTSGGNNEAADSYEKTDDGNDDAADGYKKTDDGNDDAADGYNDASGSSGGMTGEQSSPDNSRDAEQTTEENTVHQNEKTAEQVMLDFVSEKPGKFGDILWCELYVVNPGDGPDGGVFGEDYIAFIVKKGTCEADTEYLYYTADRNEAVLINSFGFGHTVLYSDPSTGELYLVYGQMGDGEIYRLYIEHGLQMSVYKENLRYDDADDLIEDGWQKVQGTSLSYFAD